MNYNFATHANRLKACNSFFIKDIKYALTYLSACNGEVDDFTRRGEGMKYRKTEVRYRKYEEELDDDNDENVEKVILLNWESLMCKAP